MRSFPRAAAAALVTAAAVAPAVTAQCPFATASLQPVGQGCNPVFGTPPGVAVALDPTTCTVQLTVSAFGGCCNTFLVGRMLVLGVQAVSIPVPQLGSGCTLLADPVVLLYLQSASGGTFAFSVSSLPPGPVSFHAQGGAHYFTTIGLSHDFALTAGAQITLQ
jgi:hypothetical protein